jgi:hypothetical protein
MQVQRRSRAGPWGAGRRLQAGRTKRLRTSRHRVEQRLRQSPPGAALGCNTQMDTTDRPARHHCPRRPNPAPPADHDRRSPDPPRLLLDAHLPTRWPWPADYLSALARIRSLPAA